MWQAAPEVIQSRYFDGFSVKDTVFDSGGGAKIESALKALTDRRRGAVLDPLTQGKQRTEQEWDWETTRVRLILHGDDRHWAGERSGGKVMRRDF